jgi:hypothetical protein
VGPERENGVRSESTTQPLRYSGLVSSPVILELGRLCECARKRNQLISRWMVTPPVNLCSIPGFGKQMVDRADHNWEREATQVNTGRKYPCISLTHIPDEGGPETKKKHVRKEKMDSTKIAIPSRTVEQVEGEPLV